MKNDLKTIMRLAWQFFRQTHIAFSECLKKAWANYKLKKAMQKSIVRFYFQKVDGTIREAWGTLSEALTPQTSTTNNRKPNDTVQVYFDTECHQWRCFKKFNIIQLA
ncbi:Protein of unknown function [Capnocytophaga haemolytica]|uniref:DUF2693 domain-containing protein n=1 Tax=Capnocytophaga haemolytica TaxID=45243 RepID=A0AAX2GVL3_9FLAO|nr:SH3 beta-barrel fold-containing protein [Capnocytophaga haemolytica]AMD85113.1 hypothetical protein AXF12_06020 [Capnocytophaga haemolytica]SFN67810.1 Protein of unknown function [Capnocytophaga haemolytica]SNV04922.1 Uncharacterised protein [Capnocytophaga haemolytica]